MLGLGLVAKVATPVVTKVVAIAAPVVTKVVATVGGMATSVVAESTGTTVIDSAIIEELLNLCKQVMGLFTEFPLNVFLVASLVGIGFSIFKAAKRAARH
ncbi:MAG: hypothetical protein J6C06_02905 [Lachnospiraceae bacterium]|nr:hypothetical protein [Lachnospiraceae bacterium]